MGIFSFLKKLRKGKKIEEIVSEKLALSEIENWLEKKEEENKVKEKNILVVVKDKIENFNTDLRTKIILLNEFDVESKKVEHKIKGVVINSRAQYIEEVEDLMSNLENLKETKFSDFINRVDKTFLDFDKASFKNYERATILIGKEMANIKGGFKTFAKDLLETFDKNKDIPKLFQKIEFIKSKLNLLSPIEGRMTGISEMLVLVNEKINQKEKENQRLLDEIEKIKQSENYKNMLEKKEKISALKEESKQEIFALKQVLDFKALANFFHINEEQMHILKEHKENFHANFEKDNGKRIMDLLDESKLNNNTVLEKVNLIKTKIDEISNYKKEVEEDETQELYSKIKDVIAEVDNLKIERVKGEKRDEKLKANKEELISCLKQELGGMNVEVV
jgi:2-succinyl-5-enolpyruvyl-6-hydroxy-3-cyclohexene-1-carboxylate synthase